MTSGTLSAPSDFLEVVYRDLDYGNGNLGFAAVHPTETNAWDVKGEWLAQAYDAGVESVFFVMGNPVVVFAQTNERSDRERRQLLDRIWCMARPSLLFLASPGELCVFNLAAAPDLERVGLDEDARLLALVKSVARVQVELQQYHRSRVETGEVFEDSRFDRRFRADHSLIRDLGIVRVRLMQEGLSSSTANTLIGRAIFIRYLEDRGILTRTYYQEVAEGQPEWAALLDDQLPKSSIGVDPERVHLPRALRNKDFVYAVFDRLTRDFNGDLFPSDDQERTEVAQPHLDLLSRFLLGDVDAQQNLFFQIYKFDVIPVELISSIYEEFYKLDAANDETGSHYTPCSLVEYLLYEALNGLDVAQQRPRVIDPACGSGIFLVATFRRFVRARMQRSGRRLRPQELRVILRDQIFGIDLNEGAIVVAAFSLYLALLHYQEPRDIVEQMKRGRTLPHLISKGHPPDKKHFNILVRGNAFEVAGLHRERHGLVKHSFDIVLGNPPWGGKGTTPAAFEWCKREGRTVGRGERSQLFAWLALDLLKPTGRAGLLLAASILFNHDGPNVDFRVEWFAASKLLLLANMAHVRHVFFSGADRQLRAIHPFIAVVFRPADDESAPNRFLYLSAKRSAMVERTQATIFTKNDMHWLNQDDRCIDYRFWKTFWWGSHRDYNFICRLDAETTLADLLPSNAAVDRGYQKGHGWDETRELEGLRVLNKKQFRRYGPLKQTMLGQPLSGPLRARVGNRHLYSGQRILMSRSPKQAAPALGRIIARFETAPFCFTDSVLGIKLASTKDDDYKVVLGIIWSSLARYYLWYTTSMWGMRNDKIHKRELLHLPIRLPEKGSDVGRNIVDIVDELRKGTFGLSADIFEDGDVRGEQERLRLESDLDDAVFRLFECTSTERDLVRDLCSFGLPLFYERSAGTAVRGNHWPDSVPRAGNTNDLVECSTEPIVGYVKTFAEQWSSVLPRVNGGLGYAVIDSADASGMYGVVFRSIARRSQAQPKLQSPTWRRILSDLARSSVHALSAGNVYVDGLIRHVTTHRIVVIKRNQRWLWTKSMARVDAEATMLQAMNARVRSS